MHARTRRIGQLHLSGRRAVELLDGQQLDGRFRFRILLALQASREPAVGSFAPRLRVSVAVIGFEHFHMAGRAGAREGLLCLLIAGPRTGDRKEIAHRR